LARQNVEFDDNDNSLAIALGGLTQGMTLKDLTNCYQTLANEGEYCKASFIDYILDKNGKVVYKYTPQEKTIFRNDTAFLITDMLNECSKKGTAKRMSDLPFYVASKTGTSSISQKNIDAYNISYTSEDVVGCWIGNTDNSSIEIVGGGKPTQFVKDYLSKIYINQKPSDINPPSSVVQIDIDNNALANEHIVYKANNYLPERYRSKAYFSRFNTPKENFISNLSLNPIIIDGSVENSVASITFDACVYYEYDLYKLENNKERYQQTISGKHGICCFKQALNKNERAKFFVKVKAKNIITNDYIVSDNSNVLELVNFK